MPMAGATLVARKAALPEGVEGTRPACVKKSYINLPKGIIYITTLNALDNRGSSRISSPCGGDAIESITEA